MVFESTVPENLKGIRPFIVQISEDSREPQVWRVFDDRPLQYYFKIVKKMPRRRSRCWITVQLIRFMMWKQKNMWK